MPVTVRGLNRATLARQRLLERDHGSVAEVIGRLAGLQAQHADAPYVALWSRREGHAIADLEAALHERSVVKATLMRSTLHLAAAADFPILDGAASDGRTAVWAATARRAGVDLDDLHDRLLAFCREPRSVEEMDAHLADEVPGLFGQHAASGVRHTAFRLASAGGGLVHVPPSGLWRSHGKPRYVAARAWLGDGPAIDPEQAATAAVERYLGAYGPASEADIGKWLGQPRVTRIRAALERLGERVMRLTGDDGRDLVDLVGGARPDDETPAPARFLSRWDSVLIAYDVRERILPPPWRAAVIKNNGDFLPTFLVDGFVAGLWSVAVSRGTAVLELRPFARVPSADRHALEAEGARLVRYVEPGAARHDIRWATG